MIITLKNADFSINNIGKIDINEKLNENTKEILSKYSRQFTDTQKLALQHFVNGLKSNGIWEHMCNLYIPALAGDMSEMLYNIKTGVVDSIPDSEYYQSESYGLRTKEFDTNTVVPTEKCAKVKMNGSYMNLHYAVYLASPLVYEEGKENVNYFITTDDGKAYKGFRSYYTTGNSRFNLIVTGNPDKYAISDEHCSGFVCATCASDGLNRGIINNVTGNVSQTETTDTTMTDSTTWIGCSVQRWAKCTTPMRLISMGSALTDEELILYNTLCDTFISSIC